MTLSRRSLLTGLLSSAAVIAAGPVAKVIPSAPSGLFGPGPEVSREIWESAEVQAWIEGISQKIMHQLWYGDPEVSPLAFTGFAPRIVGVFPKNSNAGMTFAEME